MKKKYTIEEIIEIIKDVEKETMIEKNEKDNEKPQMMILYEATTKFGVFIKILDKLEEYK